MTANAHLFLEYFVYKAVLFKTSMLLYKYQTVEKVRRKLGFFAIMWYNIVGDENAGRKENGEQPQRWRNRQLE